MAEAAQSAGARIVIVGMQLPPNYGRQYSQDFAALFAEVAAVNKAALVPFLLKGVADIPDAASLFQADRIHPSGWRTSNLSSMPRTIKSGSQPTKL
jgi:acyl-CoA thioesterase-1